MLSHVLLLFRLSPFPVSAVQSLYSASPVDFAELFSLQQSCPEMTAFLINPSLRVDSVPYGGSSVLSDLSNSLPCPLVSISFRCRIFNSLHIISDPSVHTTRRLVSCAFVWSGLAKNVSNWARGCLHCQWSKVHQQVHSPVPQIPVPARQ